MTDITIKPAQSVQGYVELPGDKSVSHRAVMLAALGSHPIRLTNLALSDDVRSTINAMKTLGAQIAHDERDPTIVTITGNGMRGLAIADGDVIDCGNAGTLARLLPGLLVGQKGSFTLTGDESLSLRPMRRVSGPLTAMGATIKTSPTGTLPMTVTGTDDVRGIDLELEIPSAQVQTAVLFAGLFADDLTAVTESAQMRDHTERMLRRAGVQITRNGNTVTVHPATTIELPDTTVPADPSSAAPFVVAASLLRGSRLRLPGVMINPGRSGLFDVMERMHAAVGMLDRRTVDGEPIADLDLIASRQLVRTPLRREEVPSMIDELPLFALLAHFCKGPSVVKGAGELRVKESDRITTLVTSLRRIGVSIDELADGFVVKGSGVRLEGGELNAEGDHRIAMLGGVAGLVSRKGVTITGAECVDVSFPGFFQILNTIAER